MHIFQMFKFELKKNIFKNITNDHLKYDYDNMVVNKFIRITKISCHKRLCHFL